MGLNCVMYLNPSVGTRPRDVSGSHGVMKQATSRGRLSYDPIEDIPKFLFT